MPVAEERLKQKSSELSSQKPWTLRYKYGNHPAETGTILASSREKAEQVGRLFCIRKGAGKMQQVRYICIEDPILADESILEPLA